MLHEQRWVPELRSLAFSLRFCTLMITMNDWAALSCRSVPAQHLAELLDDIHVISCSDLAVLV